MSILNGASGQNDNTIIYIVNALNGDIRRADTLAKQAGALAHKAENDAEQAVLLIANVRDEFWSELELKADHATLEITQNTVADLVNEYGELVDVISLKADSSEVTQTANSLTTTFTQMINETNGNVTTLQTYIQETADGLLVGKNTSPVKLRITNDRIEIIEGNKVVTYWSNMIQVTPSSLVIPEGGNFTMGNFRWVPRSSGNLSIVKVS